MPMFKLEQIDGHDRAALIVRAANVKQARKVASERHVMWADDTMTSCSVVRLIGPPMVVLQAVKQK
jgi:hypothetical protein